MKTERHVQGSLGEDQGRGLTVWLRHLISEKAIMIRPSHLFSQDQVIYLALIFT